MRPDPETTYTCEHCGLTADGHSGDPPIGWEVEMRTGGIDFYARAGKPTRRDGTPLRPGERVIACSEACFAEAARRAGWRLHAFEAKYLWGGMMPFAVDTRVMHVCTVCGQARSERVSRARYDALRAAGMTGGAHGVPAEPPADGECPGRPRREGG